jgi:hypothetical protein
MPRGDQSGPEGKGPKTGRGAGFCAGFDMPGYANNEIPRLGIGWRSRRRGQRLPFNYCGRGFGGMRFAAYEVPDPVNITPEEKLGRLKQREKWLQEQLNEIQEDIQNIEGDSKKS